MNKKTPKPTILNYSDGMSDSANRESVRPNRREKMVRMIGGGMLVLIVIWPIIVNLNAIISWIWTWLVDHKFIEAT